MTFVSWAKKLLNRPGVKKNKMLPLSRTSLAYVESFTIPQSYEVIIRADLNCTNCQTRLANAISDLDDFESILIDLREKNVMLKMQASFNK